MAKRIGFGNYQYEVVENWPKVEIRGAVADVCIDARGRVYAGVRNPREDGSVSNILGGVGHVLILDRDGHEIGSWGNLASSPHGIWVNQAGEIYLADTGFHTITKHAPTGEVLLSIGTKGQKGPDGQPFNMPTHAVEAPNGDIFVSDGYGQNRIHRFSAKGEHLLTFGGGDSVFIPKRFNLGPVTGRPGTDPCQFNVPHELLVTEQSCLRDGPREPPLAGLHHRRCVRQPARHVSHPNRVALDADGTFHIAGGAASRSGSATGPRSAAGGRRAKRQASLSLAVSMAPGWTPTAPSTPPKPAATTASRSSSASERSYTAGGGRRMECTPSAAPSPLFPRYVSISPSA